MSTYGPFHEDWIAPHTDPLEPSRDVDYAALDRDLGLFEPGEVDAEQEAERRAERQADRLKIINALGEFLFKGVNLSSPDADRVLGRKVIAVFWITNPAWFDGKSIAAISKLLGLNQRQTLSKMTSDASRHFGFTTHAQVHGDHNRRKVRPAERVVDSAPQEDR